VKSKLAVVTGGAGGMGLAAAHVLGRDSSVLISDVNKEHLHAAHRELVKAGIDCAAIFCDITDGQSVGQLVEYAESLGTVSSVVHAAGVSPGMGSAERVMKINAVGTVNINEAFLAIAHASFAVVNVASMAAHTLPQVCVPTRRFAYALHDEQAFLSKMAALYRLAPARLHSGFAYMLSKTFVKWYCVSQAERFGRQGARILSVSPGSIDTAMGRLEEQAGSGAIIQHSALKRFGTAEEVGELLAFCASDKPGYLTGTDILCDGGVMAAMTLRDKLAVARDH
jgi:NAD(P)-dependent dehydrogenase (short-subunit alcohol dehydrogenase family)